MNIEIILSLLSALCSLIGSLGGILVTSKLNLYRLEQLEKKCTRSSSKRPVPNAEPDRPSLAIIEDRKSVV